MKYFYALILIGSLGVTAASSPLSANNEMSNDDLMLLLNECGLFSHWMLEQKRTEVPRILNTSRNKAIARCIGQPEFDIKNIEVGALFTILWLYSELTLSMRKMSPEVSPLYVYQLGHDALLHRDEHIVWMSGAQVVVQFEQPVDIAILGRRAMEARNGDEFQSAIFWLHRFCSAGGLAVLADVRKSASGERKEIIDSIARQLTPIPADQCREREVFVKKYFEQLG